MAYGCLSSQNLWAQQENLSLQDAISFALAHRPELRASADWVRAAEKDRDQAGLIPNPHFIFRKEDLRPEHFNFGEDSQSYWEGQQLVETSGRRGGRIAVAQQGIVRSRLQADLERRQIILSVRESYWHAKAMQALAALYTQDAGYFQQVIDYHQARFREGKVAEIDLLRIKLEGEQIRAGAANAKLAFERALLTLDQEMNANGNTAWVLSENMETLEMPRAIPVDADPARLRVEGQIAEQAIAQAGAAVKLQKANGRPDLLFTGGYKRDVDMDSPVAGIQFELPFFNRNQGAVKAAQAQIDAAREMNEATRNRLLAELSIAQREYNMRRDQYVNIFKPLFDQAVEISDISRAAYQAGGLDLLRFLDAERARVDAQLSYVRALEGFHQSVASLDYAEGAD
ncbi:MAG: TolC family protein [Acidobacteriaceae bacterium]